VTRDGSIEQQHPPSRTEHSCIGRLIASPHSHQRSAASLSLCQWVHTKHNEGRSVITKAPTNEALTQGSPSNGLSNAPCLIVPVTLGPEISTALWSEYTLNHFPSSEKLPEQWEPHENSWRINCDRGALVPPFPDENFIHPLYLALFSGTKCCNLRKAGCGA